MAIFNAVIIATLLFGTFASDLPLAPYNVKLFCRMGRTEVPDSDITALCPTASTSCGYLEFSSAKPKPKSKPATDTLDSVYECVDSSVFVTENDDNENEKEALFKRYCDDHSRCRLLSADLLNEQFVEYLATKYHVQVQNPLETRVKFCCAVNNILLDKVIGSGLAVLPTPAARHVECNSKKCEAGAIGCLIYSKYIERDYVDEVIKIQPVHINFDDYDDHSIEQSVDEHYVGPDYSNEYHCVRRHLNDELYRYCVFVEKERLPGQCFQGKGYRVCCCLFTPDESTCDPLVHATLSTTTQSPLSTLLDQMQSAVTSTTTNPVVEMLGKPAESVAEALTLSDITMLSTTVTVPPQTHSHLTTSLSDSTSHNTLPINTDILSTSSGTAMAQHSDPEQEQDWMTVKTAPDSEGSRRVAAVSTMMELSQATDTTTSHPHSTTATIMLLRTRCRAVTKPRLSPAIGNGARGSTKTIVCDNEFNTASANTHITLMSIVTLLCLSILMIYA